MSATAQAALEDLKNEDDINLEDFDGEFSVASSTNAEKGSSATLRPGGRDEANEKHIAAIMSLSDFFVRKTDELESLPVESLKEMTLTNLYKSCQSEFQDMADVKAAASGSVGSYINNQISGLWSAIDKRDENESRDSVEERLRAQESKMKRSRYEKLVQAVGLYFSKRNWELKLEFLKAQYGSSKSKAAAANQKAVLQANMSKGLKGQGLSEAQKTANGVEISPKQASNDESVSLGRKRGPDPLDSLFQHQAAMQRMRQEDMEKQRQLDERRIEVERQNLELRQQEMQLAHERSLADIELRREESRSMQNFLQMMMTQQQEMLRILLNNHNK